MNQDRVASEFGDSFTYSEIFPPDLQQEIFQTVGSQEMKCLLNGDLVDGTYDNDDIYNQAIQDEETVALEDIYPMPQLQPIPANGVFSNEEYSGPLEFEVAVLPNYKSKNPWVFSAILNKVYMDISQQFPVDFKISNRPNKQLFIRTTPQYCAESHASEPVTRCIQHQYPGDPTNREIPEHVRKHVIRCTNRSSQYLGKIEEKQRLSIIFPFATPQVGLESVREMFYFVCKSSCSAPGMGRRSIEVIFTLEDESGTVLGRKCLNVRICACPKRDKEKEENEHKGKVNNAVPRGKKRKVEQPSVTPGKVIAQPEELKEYELNLKVLGKYNIFKVLTYVEDLALADVARHQGQPVEIIFRRNLHEIQERKKNLMG